MENLFTKKVPLYFETEESQLILGDSFKILTKMKPGLCRKQQDKPKQCLWICERNLERRG